MNKSIDGSERNGPSLTNV